MHSRSWELTVLHEDMALSGAQRAVELGNDTRHECVAVVKQSLDDMKISEALGGLYKADCTA